MDLRYSVVLILSTKFMTKKSAFLFYVGDKNGKIYHKLHRKCPKYILSPTSVINIELISIWARWIWNVVPILTPSKWLYRIQCGQKWFNLFYLNRFGHIWTILSIFPFFLIFRDFFMFKRGFETELNQYQIMIKWSGLSWVTNATIRLFGPIQNETQLTESVLFTFNRFCSIHHVNFTLRKSPKNQFAPLAL